MMYEVEKNIPIPNNGMNRRKDKSKFLSSLDVGDSFVYTVVKSGDQIGNWYSFAKVAKVKIQTSKINPNQYRIWVVEKDGVKLDETD